MKGSIWVSTFRRPEMLQKCVASIKGDLDIIVLYPPDETHEFDDPRVRLLVVPAHLSGIGAGGPRYFAGKAAVDLGHDVIIFSDDDLVMHYGVDLRQLIVNMEEDDSIGAVNGVNSKGSSSKALRPTYWIGALFAVRASAYVEVGGIVPDLDVNEDADLAIRLMCAGYNIVRDPRVCYKHRMHQPGGLASHENAEGADIKRARIDSRERTINRLVERFPQGLVVKEQVRDWTGHRINNSILEEVIKGYERGEYKITAEGVAKV